MVWGRAQGVAGRGKGQPVPCSRAGGGFSQRRPYDQESRLSREPKAQANTKNAKTFLGLSGSNIRHKHGPSTVARVAGNVMATVRLTPAILELKPLSTPARSPEPERVHKLHYLPCPRDLELNCAEQLGTGRAFFHSVCEPRVVVLVSAFSHTCSLFLTLTPLPH